MSLINTYIIDPIEYERLQESRDRWRDAADALMVFIHEHVLIVGFDEITAFHEAQDVYAKAVIGD